MYEVSMWSLIVIWRKHIQLASYVQYQHTINTIVLISNNVDNVAQVHDVALDIMMHWFSLFVMYSNDSWWH